MKKLIKELQRKYGNNTIEYAVLKESLDYDNPKDFFTDLLQHGCSSGMGSCLIRYSDTHKFFDEHYNQIEKIRQDFEENIGPLKIKDDLKNFLAWFAFEETARKLYESDLEQEF